jgi:hypothetical protein
LYEGKDAEDRIHLIYDCDRAERDLKSGVLRTMRLMCEREGEELLPEGRIHLDPESGELTTVSGSTMMGYGVYNTRKPDKKRRMDNVDVVYVLYTEFNTTRVFTNPAVAEEALDAHRRDCGASLRRNRYLMPWRRAADGAFVPDEGITEKVNPGENDD